MKISILGKDWKIKVLSAQDFAEEYGDDIGAVTLPDLHEVHFCASEPLIVHVRHELFHCYFHDYYEVTFGSNLDLTQGQLEELSACLVGEQGEELVKLSKRVYNYIKKRAKALST